MRVGAKKIFHLEAWVVKVMTLIKVRARPSPCACAALMRCSTLCTIST